MADRHHLTRGDNLYEDFTVGETIVHPRGRTVGDEHMALTNLVLNTAQLHFNQAMCDADPKTYYNGRRIMYGGIVFAFVSGLASEETAENAVAELSYDEGRHLNPVFAGDTLFAESTVLEKHDDDPRLATCAPQMKPGMAGVVKMKLVGKNQRGEVVLEITRELAVLKREFPPVSSREPERPKATRSGIPIRPLYGPDDVREAPPAPGEFPFTRGIHRSMYLGKLWTMRQYAGFGTPRETNARFKYLLEQGQTGLSLALDLPTQLGLDADDPDAEGEVGKVGVSIGSLADMEELFAGIPLAKVSTSMTINATAGILLALYEEAARRQGVPAERISGTVQNDLLKEFGARGAWLFPIEPSMRLCCDVIEDTVKRLPRFNPVSIASHYRDAGATPAEEMAYTLSAGKAYAQALVARGGPADQFAPRLSFFFYTYTNFFEEVAKYRAGRRLWAKLMRDGFGAKEPESWRLRAACVCGGHSLTRAEPLNNIARTTLETFAVACSGLQSVFTAAFDEAFAIPTELSARTALRVQQVVAYETEVAQTADPLGGSYFVEALTDEMEEAIGKLIAEIDARGGFVECLRTGWVQQRIATRAYEHQRAVETGAVPVVGVNAFTVGEAHDEPGLELAPPSPEAAREAVARVKRVRAERDGAKTDAALARLEAAARGPDNLQPFIREAVAAYATVGEIAAALKRVFGVYQPLSRF